MVPHESVFGTSTDTCTAPGLPQQKIREDRLAFTFGKRAAAGAACYLAINGSRTGFGFDDLM